jgi:hypothetical protein
MTTGFPDSRGGVQTGRSVPGTQLERLIWPSCVDPLKAGGVADARRVEAPAGDLHQFALNGELLDLNQARAAIAARKVTA